MSKSVPQSSPEHGAVTPALLADIKNAGLMPTSEPGQPPSTPAPRPGDYRRDFALIEWQQGALLITPSTRRWSRAEQEAAHGREQRQAFAHFKARDVGRSRAFLCEFPTAEECRAAVAEHNRRLAMGRPLLADLAQRERPLSAPIAAVEEQMIAWLIASP